MKENICEKNCFDYNAMIIFHKESCNCSCHSREQSKEHLLIMWIAEYTYRKANPKSKRDVPSIVYEQVEKDYKKFFKSPQEDK